ncbi:helix-turn-helix domain-containing protein [Phenylobacterium sp.]|uniref:helix-turn-helix domain-containing protein n=1 Tax=Phenylobacterium sp. TaxID=1871053 RepID=UPI003D296A06
MDQRLRFVGECLAGEASMTELCEAYGISRRVGYKWLGRYAAEGPAGLADRSHAPLRHGRSTSPELAEKIVELRRARPHWGPRKIVARLEALHPDLAWPSHSTADEILRKAGLVKGRRLRRRAPVRAGALVTPERPNQVWAVDHKGWVRLGDGSRCEPLTLADAYSRFLLTVSAGGGTSAAEARPVMERAFRTYGLPQVIRSDNGPPFATASPTGLSALSVWWIKLGIQPERILPGRPQENGRLERLHLTLLETLSPPAADRKAQARRFAAFRAEYNHDRPHQALDQLTPARFYSPSPRPMPRRLPEPEYGSDLAVRKVRTTGEIKWRGELVQISHALAGEGVAIEEIDHGWRVWFYRQPIGLIDPHGRKLLPIQPG